VVSAGVGLRGPDLATPPDAATRFEIGSVTKGLTGMLLADLVADGTVRLDQRVQELLPRLRGTAVGTVTLEELATHRSGLPRVPADPRALARAAAAEVTAGNPYDGVTPASLVDSAAAGGTDGRGEFAYSNLGMALLGHALAASASTSYPELLERRILRPLGMSDTVVVAPGEPPPPAAAAGARAAGRPASPWPSAGYAPAGGGVWSTTTDLSRLLAALLEGRAPGAEAVRPRHSAGADDRIGLGWVTSRHGHRTVTWHNGTTGGFAAWAGHEPGGRRAAVVLSNTDRSVDRVALRLLGAAAQSERADGPGLARVLGTVVLSLWGGAALLVVARRRDLDRLRVVEATLSAVALLGLAAVLGAWQAVPSAVWLAGTGLAGVGLALAGSRWRGLPPTPRRRPALRWASTLTTGALALLVVLLAALPG